MNVISSPAVHPVEAPPMNQDAAVMGLIRMKDVQGMPGTCGGLLLRLSQSVFSLIALSLMVSIREFSEITAFCFLVAAVSLQSLWGLSLVLVDAYCLLVGRSLRNCKLIRLFTIGDGITSTLTFASACASAGITVLIDNDLDECHSNHCAQLESATAMAFLCWFAVSPSFLMNFWSLATG